jgi:hypothetical protein
MSFQTTSDLGVEVMLAARDGIRLRLVSHLRRADAEPLDHPMPNWPQSLQVASPPPERVDGRRWYEPIRDLNGRPLFDDEAEADSWRRGVRFTDDCAPLGPPALETVVLDQQVMLGFQWARAVHFSPEGGHYATGFVSGPYDQPDPGQPMGVDFYGEFELAWRHELEPDAWVAISFERFEPGRQSVEFLAKVTDAWLFRPPSGRPWWERPYPKGASTS